MTISVITPCLNMASTVERTLSSVAAQTYPVYEYVIVDGQSTDATHAVLAGWQARLPMRIISEPPRGVYAAMNAGLRVVRGDIVYILNADDYVHNPAVFERVVEIFQRDSKVQVVYGDIVYVDSRVPHRLVRRWVAGSYTAAQLRQGWAMPHPAVFVRRSVYEQYGLFDERFRIAGDYEIMIRWLAVHGISVHYLSAPLAVMSAGGRSASSLRQRVRGWQELRRAWTVNGLVIPPGLIIRRVAGKVFQYFVR